MAVGAVTRAAHGQAAVGRARSTGRKANGNRSAICRRQAAVPAQALGLAPVRVRALPVSPVAAHAPALADDLQADNSTTFSISVAAARPGGHRDCRPLVPRWPVVRWPAVLRPSS